jgi:hypothetical protein
MLGTRLKIGKQELKTHWINWGLFRFPRLVRDDFLLLHLG